MTDLLIGLSSSPTTFAKTEVVFRAPGGAGQLFRNSEMRHSRSEDLLGPPSARTPSPPAAILAAAASEDDLVAASALSANEEVGAKKSCGFLAPRSPHMNPDRVDPEDSIRDIVTENDLYRFVLFKRHYDKYVALAARYEEARGLAYYLEERYHEVKYWNQWQLHVASKGLENIDDVDDVERRVWILVDQTNKDVYNPYSVKDSPLMKLRQDLFHYELEKAMLAEGYRVFNVFEHPELIIDEETQEVEVPQIEHPFQVIDLDEHSNGPQAENDVRGNNLNVEVDEIHVAEDDWPTAADLLFSFSCE